MIIPIITDSGRKNFGFQEWSAEFIKMKPANVSVQMSASIRSQSAVEYLKNLSLAMTNVGFGIPYDRALKYITRKKSPNVSYKCGCLVFSRMNDQIVILVVRQSLYPYFWGPPKGSWDVKDTCAIDTAVRELYEETGINYHDGRAGNTCILLSRWPQDSMENMIYYTVYFAEPPEVILENNELSEYQWIPLNSLADIKNKVSTPTAHLFQILERAKIDFSE